MLLLIILKYNLYSMVMTTNHQNVWHYNSNENKKEALFPSILNGIKNFFKESVDNILNKKKKVDEKNSIINNGKIGVDEIEKQKKTYKAPVNIYNESYKIEKNWKVNIDNNEINFLDIESKPINDIISIEKVKYYITESYYIKTIFWSYIISISQDKKGSLEFKTKTQFNLLNWEEIVSNIPFESKILTFWNFEWKGKILTNLFSNNNFNTWEYLENSEWESIEIFKVFKNNDIIYIISKDNLVYEYKWKKELEICNDNKIYENIIKNKIFYKNSEIKSMGKNFVTQNSQRLINNSCIGYIKNNITKLKEKFPKIDFDWIIEWKIWIYDYKKDELNINGIIFWNWYIRSINEPEKLYRSNPNKLDEIDKYNRNNICKFIAKNIGTLKDKFSDVDFSDVIRIWEYNKIKDELTFKNIIVWNWYIKYKDNLDKKPNFYLIDNPKKVVVKLNSENISGSPDIDISFNNWRDVKLSFKNYSTYLKCLNFIQSNIYIYKQIKGKFEEVLMDKLHVIKELEEALNLEEKDFHFDEFEIIN